MPRIWPLVKRIPTGAVVFAQTFVDKFRMADAFTAALDASSSVKQDSFELEDAMTVSGSISAADKFRATDGLSLAPTLPDKFRTSDALGATSVAVQDSFEMEDAMSARLPMTDKSRMADTMVIASASIPMTDKARFSELLIDATFTGLIYGRSGTPDTDQGGDNWIDNTHVFLNDQRNVNHGSAAALNIRSSLSGLAPMRAHLETDFTRYANLIVDPAAVHRLHITVTGDTINTGVFDVNLYTQVGRWFTESTENWNNAPGAGGPGLPAAVATFAGNNIAPGVTTAFTFTLTDVQMAAILGNWVLIVLTGTDTLGVLMTAHSREDTVATRWSWDFGLQR